MNSRLVLLLALLILTTRHEAATARKLPVFKYMEQQVDLSEFTAEVRKSPLARSGFSFREITVFAPTNEALNRFAGAFDQNVSAYHICTNAYKLADLNADTYFESIKRGLPPIWVRRVGEGGGDIYVNNAKIVSSRSDYYAHHLTDYRAKLQVLHVVDEVLNPTVGDSETQLDAFALLAAKKFPVKTFLGKIIRYELENEYIHRDDGDNNNNNNAGGNTYFIPVDEGMDDYRTKMTDRYVVKAHIIPNRVLFTRATPKNAIYDSLADVDYIYVLLSFSRENVRDFIKSNTILGDATHRNGEIKAEIIYGNIPVKNGVVHIINRPLAVFDRVLTKFPFLPVLDKLAMDPYLNISYTLGNRTGFNRLLRQPRKFTFFIPKDQGWKKLKGAYDYDRLLEMKYTAEIEDVLGRHLVVGDIPYAMETLHNASTSSCVFLKTASGRICLSVLYKANEGRYVIKWNNQYIDVYKANYECSDGLVHIIDRPLITSRDFERVPEEEAGFLQLWGALTRILSAR